MADNIVGNQSSFAKTDIENARQQFCHCCQNEYVWDCREDTDNAPATLTCGHLLCLNCIRTQWLDSTTQDGTVFCLSCTKRVTLVHLKTTEGEDCEDKMEPNEHSLSVQGDDDTNGVWTIEQKDGIPVQEWVNTNICENFVLKLISGTESCMASNALTLDNSASVTTTLMEHTIIPRSCNSLSPIKQERSSEKTVMGYIVNKSSSETVINDTHFQDNSGGMTGQTNIGSPDLNLKSLLQMLERNSLPSLGAGSGSNEIKNSAESFNCIDITCKEEIECFKKSQNVYDSHEIEAESPMMPEKHLCEEIGGEDDWLPVEIVQNGSFVTTKGKLPKMQTCGGYLPNSEIITTDDYICMTPTSRNLHEMDKVGVDSVPHLWFSQNRRDFSHNKNSRSRRGRKRKPLLRHCQSEFFARPCMKREHSPQLQLVKLVRQRVHDKREEEEKAIATAVSHEEKFHRKTEMTKRHVEDPELAFMKTVDMPSGKRVEDIYVVPSVWISNEKKNAGKPSCSREPMNFSGTDFCSLFPLEGTQRVPLPVHSHGSQARFLNSYQTPYVKQGQGSFCGAQPSPLPSFSNPSRKALHSSSVSNTHSFKPTQNIYKVIRGHIITTLNAPKLDHVPSLKDLCKSALRLEAVTAISYLRESNKYAYTSENHINQSNLEENEASREMSSEIKTPKEFLDMVGASTHQELKLQELENKTECADKVRERDQSPKDPSLQVNSVASTDIKNPSQFEFYDKTEKLSDNEEMLPENPLFTEDIQKTETKKTSRIGQNSCDEHLQTKKCKNTEHQFHNHTDVYPTSGPAETSSHVKENFKCFYPTASTSLKDNNDYIIPIVSYRLADTVKGGYITNQKPDSHNSDYVLSQDDSGSKKYDIGSYSISSHGSNSYPMVLEDTYCDDNFESNLTNLPSLISVAKEITSLALTEPLNRPLANLTAALNLLCSAEKSLCNSNFAMYKQVKSETKSKIGRLSLCIRKLADLIVTVGGTLQEWMKLTSSQCFKTLGVLTEMYNSNIVALSELITPYFQHICELISSSHSEDVPWNKKELSVHDRPRSLADHLSMTTWLDSNVDYQFLSSCRPDTLSMFTYANNQHLVYPKNYPNQDCDNMKEGSDTSLSEPGSTKVSPKVKGVSSVKGGRPLATNNGQRKTRVSYLTNKQKQMLSIVGSRRNQNTCSDLGGTTSGQAGMHLPNTLLVKMSYDSIWGEGDASDLPEPQNAISHTTSSNVASEGISFEAADPQLAHIPTSTSSWMLPSGASDSCHSIPVQLSISGESSKTTLSLLDSDLNSIMDDPDMSSVGDLKDTSSECSPNKKNKFEQDDANAYSNIMVALPEGIKIVVSNASSQNEAASATCSTNTLPLHESAVDSLNICSADLQNFQNIYFIHNSENPDDYLQLDPDQLSNALMNTLKGSKDMHEQMEIALMQDGLNNTLGDHVKEEEMEETESAG